MSSDHNKEKRVGLFKDDYGYNFVIIGLVVGIIFILLLFGVGEILLRLDLPSYIGYK